MNGGVNVREALIACELPSPWSVARSAEERVRSCFGLNEYDMFIASRCESFFSYQR